VGLRGAGQRGVLGQKSGDQRVVTFGQASEQGRLRGIQAFQRFSQIGRLRGGEGDGLVATGIAQLLGGLGHQFAGRVEQRQGIEDFQPVALAVLGANAEGDAEERSAHSWVPCNESGEIDQANAAWQLSGLKPTRVLSPRSSTGRLIIEGWASISLMALAWSRSAFCASSSLRKVVPARLRTVCQPCSLHHFSRLARSIPAVL